MFIDLQLTQAGIDSLCYQSAITELGMLSCKIFSWILKKNQVQLFVRQNSSSFFDSVLYAQKSCSSIRPVNRMTSNEENEAVDVEQQVSEENCENAGKLGEIIQNKGT